MLTTISTCAGFEVCDHLSNHIPPTSATCLDPYSPQLQTRQCRKDVTKRKPLNAIVCVCVCVMEGYWLIPSAPELQAGDGGRHSAGMDTSRGADKMLSRRLLWRGQGGPSGVVRQLWKSGFQRYIYYMCIMYNAHVYSHPVMCKFLY